MTLCFIVDVNVAHLARGLRRRGFVVYEPHKDYPADADDMDLIHWAEGLGCVIVTADLWLHRAATENGVCAVYVDQGYIATRNTWDQVTRVVKQAALCARKRMVA